MKRVEEMSSREMGEVVGLWRVRKEELEVKVVIMEEIVGLMSDCRRLEGELKKLGEVGWLFEDMDEREEEF